MTPSLQRLTICLACSHGGHLTEMLQLREAFEGHDTFYFCYDADTTRALPDAHLVPNMARNPIEFLKNLVRVFRMFRRRRPDLVVSTGAEIAIPVLIVAKLCRVPMLYIECGAQVSRPSVTGRVMYRLADWFHVQWPELARAYGPRAVFRGSLIDQDQPFQGDHSLDKRMKVSLVQPAHTGGFSSDQPPTGLGYLASVLERHGCEVRLIDAHVERLSVEEVVALLVQQQPHMVCLTVTTPLLPGALSIARSVREVFENPPVLVAGGPHPTVLAEEMLAPGQFDHVVRGEGEGALAELVECVIEGKDPERVPGVSWRRDGRIVHNPDRTQCEDLERLPVPDWSLYPLRRYSSLARRHDFSLPIMTSRGCPHRCTFCYKGIYGNDIRMRSPENVVAEWELLIKRYGAKEIAVIDDVFTENAKRAIAICDLLVERGLHTIPWSTTNGIRVNNVSPRLMEALKRAGCYRVYFGAESGVQRVIDALQKNITVDRVREAVHTARAAGLEVGVYFMLGNVTETREEMETTIDFALELDPDLVQFTVATPYPGTEMYRQVVENGQLLITSWDELATYGGSVFRMDNVTPDLVDRMYRKALRKFYFRPRFILRQTRALTTWTGFRHRLLATWLLLKMTLPGTKRA